MEVCKEITICTAHMLSGHNGRCKNLHGHNYKACVALLGDNGEKIGSSARMIMDFGELKNVVSESIDGMFDHALVFSSKQYRGGAEAELLDWAIKWGMRHVLMPDGKRSTAEDMAKVMAEMVLGQITASTVWGVRVTLWETPTSYATAEAMR